jgi:hypothetical protein
MHPPAKNKSRIKKEVDRERKLREEESSKKTACHNHRMQIPKSLKSRSPKSLARLRGGTETPMSLLASS